MSNPVIKVENLGKKYIIGHQQKNYKTIRESMVSTAKTILNPFQYKNANSQNSKEEFWALKGMSFEIKPGERVGIIGRNGAGKSTLLKVLSRITYPTTGSVRTRGRIASLLEVGTGFHQELSGRENIFLNGAILGMSKTEIQRKFDEIVAFAEVEQFLDTPVKRYSSGMYVRLAFAIAAHLEPEILIVDEVLAVGDVEFQKKCLGKMEEVASQEGRTILFVSHIMSMIDTLCNRCILLQKGKVVADGLPKEITNLYLSDGEDISSQVFEQNRNSDLTFLKVFITNQRGENVSWVDENEDFYLNCEFLVRQPIRGAEIGIQGYSESSNDVIFASLISDSDTSYSSSIKAGLHTVSLLVKGNQLQQGNYYVSLFAHIPYQVVYDERPHAICLSIKPNSNNDVRRYFLNKPGLFKLEAQWITDKSTSM